MHEVSITARDGEITRLLLDSNGAGTTTAIRLVSTILGPTGGEFTVGGIRIPAPVIRGRIGVLSESAGRPAHQTTATRARADVDDRKVPEIGTGMAQRG